ncbi:unnamed protein product, partial [Larinioides sclopetarius]
EATPAEFLLGDSPELDNETVLLVRRVFRRAQRRARRNNRLTVIDTDVILSMT